MNPHTHGKHLVLRRYLSAWFPIVGSFARRLAFIDGFAGPGEYSDGEPGSPIIALEALVAAKKRGLVTLRGLHLEIDRWVGENPVAALLTTIDGLGTVSVARIVAAVGDPARFRNGAALAAYVGVVPGTKESGLRQGRRATLCPLGNARLRHALYMTTLGAVRTNPWLRAFYERLKANGKLPKVALLAAMRKLLTAVYSVARHRKPFVPREPTTKSPPTQKERSRSP